MNQTVKRSMALLMAIIMCIGLLPALHLNADAATTVTYKYSDDGYIYNWGTREEPATFLSPNAEKFYSDNNASYADLSELSGSTTTSEVPSSSLFIELQKLMAKHHEFSTSYDTEYGKTRYWFCYTDCENNGDPTSISSFYSGAPIGPEWDKGDSWNREHTWPNSKSAGSAAENGVKKTIREADIMMLRPTANAENGGRSNKAYGESDSCFHPNTFAGTAYDLRGDVARIVLYVYVRWGGDSTYADGALDYMWGSNGVIESKDVLLKWMAADPVDTWELGRNDSVESITGTRNVFVDYPELAFLLFGEDIPKMDTPSGEADGGCGHNNFAAGTPVPATCTTFGYTPYTCQTAGCTYSYKGNKVPALGHSYTEGKCSVCGAAEPVAPTPDASVVDTPVANTAYKFGMVQGNLNKTYYLAGGMDGYYMATTEDVDAAIDVYLEETTDGYYFYTMSGSTKTYINMVVSDDGEHVNGAYEATASTVYAFDAESKTIIAQVNGEPYWFGTRNDKQYTTVGPCKTSYNGFYCQFYAIDSGENPEGPGEPPAPETTITVVDAPDADAAYKFGMVQGNLNKTYYLAGGMDGYYMATTEDISAAIDVYLEETTGGYYFYTMSGSTKTYINMVVSADGAHVNGAYEATASTVYAFDAENKTIIAQVNGEPYWFGTRNDKQYTTVGPCATSYNGFYCQFYAVTTNEEEPPVEEPDPSCKHQNTEDVPGSAATCTEPGYTEGVYCIDCETYISGHEEIPAPGHTWLDATIFLPQTCSVCGETEGTALGQPRRVAFLTPNGVKAWECNNLGITLPTLEALGLAAPDGYTFLGWVDAACVDSTTEPEFKKAGDPFTTEGNAVLYALFSYKLGGAAATVAEPEETKVNVSIATYATANGWTNSKAYLTINMDENVTVTASSGANNAKYYTSDNTWRLYQADSGKITISSAEGYTIDSVKITYNAGKYGTLTYNGSNVATKTVVNVNADAITFGVGRTKVEYNKDGSLKTNGQAKITAIEVVYTKNATSGEETPIIYYTTVTSDMTCTHKSAAWDDNTDATCTQTAKFGALTCTCSEDALVAAAEDDEIPGHNYQSVVTNPDCTNPGYTTHTCSVCGDNYTDNETNPTGHTFVDGICSCGTAAAAQIGETYYETLQEAIAAAAEGQTVTLLTDIEIAEMIKLEKAVTLDLNDHKVTATSKKAFEVYANVTIKNGTIEAANRCVDTRTAVELTLENMTLIADEYTSAYGNPQPLTIGGSDDGTVLTIINSTISAKAGYGIISFVKTQATITNTTITGYNALYVKEGSEESKFNFVNCQLTGDLTDNDVEDNAFTVIAVQTDNITINVDAASIISAKGNNCAAIGIGCVDMDAVSGNVINVAGKIEGNVLFISQNEVENNSVTVPAEYAQALLDAGFGIKKNKDGTVTAAVEGYHNHEYAAAVTPPTCTTDGYTTYTCSCGDSYVSDRVPAEHKYEAVVTDPTCGAEGYTEMICSECGDRYEVEGSTVPATGKHIFGAWKTVKAAGCSVSGLRTRECVCGASQTEVIPATGVHTYGAWTETKAATCTAAGEKTRTCDCGDVQTAAIAALGHTEVIDAAVAATCTAAGKTEGKHCSACNEVLTAQDEIPAKGHMEVSVAGKPATHTVDGLSEGKRCAICNEVLTAQEVIPASGHSFSDKWTVTKAATEAEAGEEMRMCSCGETETREIPVLPASNNTSSVVIVVIGVAALGVIAAVAFVLLKKRF